METVRQPMRCKINHHVFVCKLQARVFLTHWKYFGSFVLHLNL